jgi:hypothetical protein
MSIKKAATNSTSATALTQKLIESNYNKVIGLVLFGYWVYSVIAMLLQNNDGGC